MYILPIAGQLQWVKVLYCPFECSFPRSKFGSSNDSVSSLNQIFHESNCPFIAISFLVLDDDGRGLTLVFHPESFSQPS